jgi:hypothetical protein
VWQDADGFAEQARPGRHEVIDDGGRIRNAVLLAIVGHRRSSRSPSSGRSLSGPASLAVRPVLPKRALPARADGEAAGWAYSHETSLDPRNAAISGSPARSSMPVLPSQPFGGHVALMT